MAEGIEGADANKSFHFFRERLDTQEEIGQQRKFAARAFAQEGFAGALREALYLQGGNANQA